MSHAVAHFGWIHDLPDQSDLVYAASGVLKRKLRKSFPSINHQGPKANVLPEIING